MRTKDDFIYYRECLFCGERFVSNRSNKTPLKFKRMGIEGARPETMCCGGRCAALRKAYGTFERYVLTDQMKDASAMLAQQSFNQWRRMISQQCVSKVRRQVAEMLKRLHKKCKACDNQAGFQKHHCDQCLRRKKRDTHDCNHRQRCKRHGAEYHTGVTLRAIIVRDGVACHYCKIQTVRWNGQHNPLMTTLDHVIPISLGGGHTMRNVVIACSKCNTRKSNKLTRVC